MSKKVKLKPILDEKIKKELNLKVLQRTDPCVQEIITTAAHVAVYEFSIDKVEWKRKNVEGSLFVVERSSEPRYQFIVMNRLHTENLVESLAGEFEIEVNGPYLLYRNQSNEVNGMWFYNASDLEEIENLFNRILDDIPKVPTKSTVSPIKSEDEEDAFSEPSFTATPKAADVVDPQCLNISSSSTAPAPEPLQSTVLDMILSASVQASSSSASIKRNPTEKGSTDLVKPTSFPFPLPSPSITPLLTPPSVPTASALISPGNLKQPYGTLLLQPFPPPASPPTSVTTAYGPIITREKVAEALQLLLQDDQFIDIVCRALNALKS